jgi:thioredoxin 1
MSCRQSSLQLLAVFASVVACAWANCGEPANEKKRPKLLDLGSKKCIPCKKMAPILEELKKEYAGQFDVEFIDVNEKENAAAAKTYEIDTIPTQIFFDAAGKELFRHVGFFSKEEILAKWKELKFEFVAPKKEKSASKPEKPSGKD